MRADENEIEQQNRTIEVKRIHLPDSSRRSLDGSMAIARSAGMAEAAMPRGDIVSTAPPITTGFRER
jgi:hypothetical protein